MTPIKLLRDQNGISAAEFAMVLPLLILTLLGIIDVGRFAWAYNQAEKATQVGARVAVVTDVISTGLTTQGYVGSGGLTQGDVIPASALSPVACTRTACTCTGSCPAGYAAANAAAFDRIVTRMRYMKPDIVASNVSVEYRGSGLGFAGDPDTTKPEISPLVTVKLVGMQFKPLLLTLFGNASITMPAFLTTLTAEDSSGSQSN